MIDTAVTTAARALVVSLLDAPMQPQERALLLAVTSRATDTPLSEFKPLERLGRVVTVAVVPAPALFSLSRDPVIPLPVAPMPGWWWRMYRAWFRSLRNHIDGGGGRLSLLTARAREMTRRAVPFLTPEETRYLGLRLLAAPTGEVAR